MTIKLWLRSHLTDIPVEIQEGRVFFHWAELQPILLDQLKVAARSLCHSREEQDEAMNYSLTLGRYWGEWVTRSGIKGWIHERTMPGPIRYNLLRLWPKRLMRALQETLLNIPKAPEGRHYHISVLDGIPCVAYNDDRLGSVLIDLNSVRRSYLEMPDSIGTSLTREAHDVEPTTFVGNGDFCPRQEVIYDSLNDTFWATPIIATRYLCMLSYQRLRQHVTRVHFN